MPVIIVKSAIDTDRPPEEVSLAGVVYRRVRPEDDAVRALDHSRLLAVARSVTDLEIRVRDLEKGGAR